MAGGVHLPDELIEEILLRVPAKSLIRFKTVSKKWHSLLSDPKFADFHLKLKLKRSSSSSSSTENLIFFQSSGLKPIFGSMDIDTNESHKFNFPVGTTSCWSLVGSANGLVCVNHYTKGDCCIWNPSTRECKKISLPIRSVATAYYSLLGFGYDSCSDDYKIVATWSRYIRVFSLKTNSWKKLEYSLPRQMIALNLNFNGALHWCRPNRIVRFDFTTEKISYMELPEELKHSTHGWDCIWFTFKVYQGLLCVSGRNSIWVMKEYGNITSWSKLASFANKYAFVVGFSRLGEVVYLRYDGSGIIKSTTKGEVSLMTDVVARDAFAYTESLISPGCFDSLQQSKKMMKRPRKQRKTN